LESKLAENEWANGLNGMDDSNWELRLKKGNGVKKDAFLIKFWISSTEQGEKIRLL